MSLTTMNTALEVAPLYKAFTVYMRIHVVTCTYTLPHVVNLL